MRLSGIARDEGGHARDAGGASPDAGTWRDGTPASTDDTGALDRPTGRMGLCLRRCGTRSRRGLAGARGRLYPHHHRALSARGASQRELGFSGVRIHQKVEDPRSLYWCDRLGLLVWGELANAYVFSPTAMTRLLREWTEVIERDYNHPCIVAWGPLNESWGVPNLPRDAAQRAYVQGLYHLTKALDPTRPAIGNDGWEHLVGDSYGIHDHSFDGAMLRERYSSPEAVERTLRAVPPGHHTMALPGYRRAGEPLMITECGGIGYRPEAGTTWFGYGTVASAQEFLARYREIV